MDIYLNSPHSHPRTCTWEITFHKQAQAIMSHSAYASATVNPNEASIGILPHNADVLPPLVASIQPGTITSFLLCLQHTEEYIRNQMALISDAAHVVHPLTGQDLNLRLGDTAALAHWVSTALKLGGDIGASTSL